ncbi:hypothetical protein Fot_04067 [Forsythia ovata]|uniref:Uncharacterized protein n=1 Tax=Forsythia ovata TaxID=205694 RepID=A0ABD1XEI4_9LAMI
MNKQVELGELEKLAKAFRGGKFLIRLTNKVTLVSLITHVILGVPYYIKRPSLFKILPNERKEGLHHFSESQPLIKGLCIPRSLLKQAIFRAIREIILDEDHP